MDREYERQPPPVEPGEAEDLGSEEMGDATHAVVASVDDMEAARMLVEDLEEHGVPPGSISLLGETGEPASAKKRDEVEAGAFSELTRSVIAGAAVGAVAGALVGIVVGLILPDANLLVAAALGAIPGAAVGGAAGGMSVAKYASPAWNETYETVQRGVIAVGVEHGDGDVVATAEEVMARHATRDVSRGEEGEFES